MSATLPTTLRIGSVEWTIEFTEALEVHILDEDDGRSEGDDPCRDFILVDRTAHRISLVGNFDWWNAGEVFIGLMKEAIKPSRRRK